MHIRLPDRQCCQPFSSTSLSFRTKFSKFVYVLFSAAVIHYFVVFHEVVELLARTSLWLLISFRVILSHVVFGLAEGFFLPVGLVQYFDYFPLQSFNWYLVTKTGVQFQIW